MSVANLESKDYMKIKNTIVILREVATCYPVIVPIGTRFQALFQNIATTDDRGDLKLLANAYLGVLKRQSDHNSWMPISQFHITKTTPEALASAESKVLDGASGGSTSTETGSTTSKTNPPKETEDRRYGF